MKTDPKLCDRDGNDNNPWSKQNPLNSVPGDELNSLHL